jgi:hypothetical protein
MKETKLTYAELEVLHYALRMFIQDANNKDSFNPLHNKLIKMRAELEKLSVNLKDEEIINTL